MKVRERPRKNLATTSPGREKNKGNNYSQISHLVLKYFISPTIGLSIVGARKQENACGWSTRSAFNGTELRKIVMKESEGEREREERKFNRMNSMYEGGGICREWNRVDSVELYHRTVFSPK